MMGWWEGVDVTYSESVPLIAVLLRVDFGEEDFVLEARAICVDVVGICRVSSIELVHTPSERPELNPTHQRKPHS